MPLTVPHIFDINHLNFKFKRVARFIKQANFCIFFSFKFVVAPNQRLLKVAVGLFTQSDSMNDINPQNNKKVQNVSKHSKLELLASKKGDLMLKKLFVRWLALNEMLKKATLQEQVNGIIYFLV